MENVLPETTVAETLLQKKFALLIVGGETKMGNLAVYEVNEMLSPLQKPRSNAEVIDALRKIIENFPVTLNYLGNNQVQLLGSKLTVQVAVIEEAEKAGILVAASSS